MPPKRRAPGTTPSSQQSTLAFHGTSNKVSKAGARAQNAKQNLIEKSVTKDVKPEVVDVSTPEEVEPSTVGAPIVETAVVAQAISTPEEDAARKISDAHIRKYWTAKEKTRKAPRVHQKELGLYEKVLREFDMSGQYGPCVGIARMQRWKRAHRLRLNPPIEVLAALLKEQEGDNKSSIQTSNVDQLLNSRDVEISA